VIKSAPTDKLAAAKTAAKLASLSKADTDLFAALATGEGDHRSIGRWSAGGVSSSALAMCLASGALPLGIDAVGAGEVKAVADKIWKSKLSIASLGDVSKVPKLSAL
jgi:hypothetical protein